MEPYKLHILYHGVKPTWRSGFEKYIQKFWDEKIKPASGIELALSTQDTNSAEQVTLKYFQTNSAGKQAFGTSNGKSISRKFVEPATYHQLMFMYDATKADLYKEMVGDKYLTSWSYWEELYSNTEFTEVKVETSTAWPKQTMAHETMHSLAKKAQRAGRSDVIDHMDVTVVDGKAIEYYQNGNPDAADGNYARTIKAITQGNAWPTITLNTRNMYEARKVKGEHTIVLRKDGKWWDVATAPELWPFVQAKYQIPTQPAEITRSEVEANKGGQAKVDIYFGA